MRTIIPISRQTQLVFSGMNGHISFLSAYFDQKKILYLCPFTHMMVVPG